MNKTIYYILFLGVLSSFMTGCDQDIDYPYEGKDRIQFRHYTTDWNGKRTYSDSLVYSFGLKNTDIQIDTAKIIVEFLGKMSDAERTYRVSIDPEKTTAIIGTHYEVINNIQTFRPLKLTDTLRVVIYREHLSASFTNPKNETIQLVMEPSEDFDLGLAKGQKLKLLINNYLSKPDWWEKNFFDGSLGFYHPQKWRILISFNQEFANPKTCPFHVNNEGKGYAAGLNSYLNNVPTYDEETGDRIYRDKMEPVE